MTETTKYVYGVIAPNEARPFDRIAFEREVQSATPECRTVSAIAHQDIAAVVSDSAISDHTHLLKDALARLLVQHQMVVETVMSLGYTVIPMRLGTFARDEREVREILGCGNGLVRAISAKVADRIEVDVVATWNDFGAVLKEIAEHPAIRKVKAELQAKPAGVSLEDQMRVGVMVKKLLDSARTELAEAIGAALKPVCADRREHDLMDDRMISNTAFLLDRARQSRFDQVIQELNTRFNGRLNFRCVGPLPPYSFCTLEARKIEFEKIEWARKKLGLVNDRATRDEIKQAHRQRAFACHPDRNAGSPVLGREFDEVTKAFRILDDFCQGELCYFDPSRFRESALQIRVRN
jgi:hypothetical protein